MDYQNNKIDNVIQDAIVDSTNFLKEALY